MKPNRPGLREIPHGMSSHPKAKWGMVLRTPTWASLCMDVTVSLGQLDRVASPRVAPLTVSPVPGPPAYSRLEASLHRGFWMALHVGKIHSHGAS